MTLPTDKKTPADEVFLEALAAELAAMPDDEVLDGVDAARVQEFGQSLLAAAKKAAGQRRLRNAKAELASRRAAPTMQVTPVSVQQARDYLARAANDERFTLAARNLDEMSDEDVMDLYVKARQLDSSGET